MGFFVGLSSLLKLFCAWARGSGASFYCSPRTGVWGRAPKFLPEGATSKNALASDHHQVELLSTGAAGLQPPQIHYQLPANGHHGFLLQCPVGASQDFLPFLHRWVLGLELDNPPDHLGNNAPNGRHPHFGDRAPPLALSGAPLARHHPGQASNLATTSIKVPIEHFASELDQTVGSCPFGPRTAPVLELSRFGPLDFFIQRPQQTDPALEHLKEPCGQQLLQTAQSHRSPPVFPAPKALAQQ